MRSSPVSTSARVAAKPQRKPGPRRACLSMHVRLTNLSRRTAPAAKHPAPRSARSGDRWPGRERHRDGQAPQKLRHNDAVRHPGCPSRSPPPVRVAATTAPFMPSRSGATASTNGQCGSRNRRNRHRTGPETTALREPLRCRPSRVFTRPDRGSFSITKSVGFKASGPYHGAQFRHRHRVAHGR